MAFSLIASTGKGGNSSTVTTDAIDTTGADLIVVGVHIYPGFSQSTPLTDSKSNTWTPLTATQSTNTWTRFYYCQGGTVGSGHTFTCTNLAGIYVTLTVLAVSGSATTPFDQENGATGTGTSVQPGSITPSEDDELIVTAVTINGSTTESINSGFTLQVNVDYLAANHMGGCLAYLIQTSAAAVNPTWSFTDSQADDSTRIASFKSADGSVVITPPAGSLSLTGYTPALSIPGDAASIFTRLGVGGSSSAYPPFSAKDAGTEVTISIPAGSLALTGLAPTLKVTISLPVGSLAFTGLAPTLNISGQGTIAIPVGSLSLTGVASTLVLGVKRAIPVGSLALTEVAPTLALSGSRTIVMPVGSLTLSGMNAIVGNSSIVYNDGALVEIELNGFGNGWTDVTRDVIGTISGSRGLPGNSPLHRVAKVGIMSLTLDNSTNNSAGLLGYYSPDHVNCREGFVKGCGVRFSIVIGGEAIPQFTGRLEIIRPATGVHMERTVSLTVVDFMHETVKKRLNTLELEKDISETDAFSAILATLPLQPRAVQIGTPIDVLPYAFDTVKDDRTSPMAEFVRLNNSTLALTYVLATGTFVYEPRSIRALNFNTLVTLGPADYMDDAPPEIESDRSTVVNRVTASIHPRTVSAEADVILYEITAPFEVQPSSNLLIRGFYTEEGLRSRRAGGLDMLPAVATTDYLFNSQADGLGDDLTAGVSVTTIFTANSVLFVLNIPTPCWCIKLQSRGTQVIDNANMSVETENADSIAEFGEVALSLDMPYNGDPEFGNEVVQYFLYLAQTNLKVVKKTPLYLNAMTDARAQLFARREISDRIAVSEPMTAVSGATFFINQISFEFDADRNYKIAWIPIVSDATQYWRLEVPGYSELGFTTRLGFGMIVGHTDVEHSDGHGDSAHADTAHNDAHGDVAHTDVAHTDVTHTDGAHGDAAHTDGAHSDSAHTDTHGDGSHDDSHTDVSHVDNHYDDHFDLPEHNDGGNYTFHGDYHSDGHSDGAHTDGHFDVPHTDEHDDVDHNDVAHVDVSHSDIAHVDSGHGDGAHSDVAHSDSHTDVAHIDTAHSDSHGDSAHGDIN